MIRHLLEWGRDDTFCSSTGSGVTAATVRGEEKKRFRIMKGFRKEDPGSQKSDRPSSLETISAVMVSIVAWFASTPSWNFSIVTS